MNSKFPKLSLITVSYNSAATIRDTLESVRTQTYPNIEYIVVDGASSDATLEIVRSYGSLVSVLCSEKDAGLYDAMNKGVSLSSGDVIGFLNSDDFFAFPDAVLAIMSRFASPATNIVYGDIVYVDRLDSSKIVRNWVSRAFARKKLEFGWMPPHPAFYARRNLFETFGGFDTTSLIAADYALMIRFLRNVPQESVGYINTCLVKMRTGGVSNQGSMVALMRAYSESVKAGRQAGFVAPRVSAFLKILGKIQQFF